MNSPLVAGLLVVAFGCAGTVAVLLAARDAGWPRGRGLTVLASAGVLVASLALGAGYTYGGAVLQQAVQRAVWSATFDPDACLVACEAIR